MCAFLIKLFLFRWACSVLRLSAAVTVSTCPHWPWVTTRRQSSLCHELYICYFALLSIYKPCFRSRVCSRVWLSIKAASCADCKLSSFLWGAPGRLSSQEGLHCWVLTFSAFDYSACLGLYHPPPPCPCNKLLPSSAKVCANCLQPTKWASQHLHYKSRAWLPEHSITALTYVWLPEHSTTALTYVRLPKPVSTFSPETCASHLLFSL